LIEDKLTIRNECVLLADGQHVPVVDIRGARGRKCAADGQLGLLHFAHGLLEGITPNVLDLGATILLGPRERGRNHLTNQVEPRSAIT